MALVDTIIEDNIATITINNGKVNVISPQVVEEINEGLDQAEAAGAIVIITGQPGILSGGYDLKTMQISAESATSLVTSGSKLTRRMLAFPLPIIVACSGHAIAKGAFLLLCADYRIGCNGPFKIGLNEVAIGMTMHQAGIEMARNRIPINFLTRSVINGEVFDVSTALKAGFLDQLVDPEALMATAKSAAQSLAKINMSAHHGTKLKERKEILEAMDSAIINDATIPLNF